VIFAVVRTVNERPHDIGGKQVGRELNAMKAGLNRCGQRADGKRLRQTGHAFQQHMAVGKQPDQQTVNELFLANDDFPNLGSQRSDPRRSCLHLFVQRCDHAASL
jgi:hypothetical protein